MFRQFPAQNEVFLPILPLIRMIPKKPFTPGYVPFSYALQDLEQPNFTQSENLPSITYLSMIQFQVYQSEAIDPLDLPELPTLLELISKDFEVKGKLSIAVLSDAEIREVNQRYLQHDYETDCISFDLSENDEELDGEVVVSADTARRVARQIDRNPNHEAILYIIHGLLHILGYNDDTAEAKAEMRSQERDYLKKLGIPDWESHPTHGEAEIEEP